MTIVCHHLTGLLGQHLQAARISSHMLPIPAVYWPTHRTGGASPARMPTQQESSRRLVASVGLRSWAITLRFSSTLNCTPQLHHQCVSADQITHHSCALTLP